VISALLCPNCLNELQELLCNICGKQYNIINDVPIMTVNNHKELTTNSYFMTNKSEVVEWYKQINEKKHQTLENKYSIFINYGYIPTNTPQSSIFPVDESVFNYQFVKLFLEVIGKNDLNGMDVLEVGCGRGGNLKTALKFFAPKSLVGLDLCLENIVFCKQRYRLYENMNFLVGDAEYLPFTNSCFDVLINIESALHYQDIDKFFFGAHRVLRNDGVLLYCDLIPTMMVSNREKAFVELGYNIENNIDITLNVLLSLKKSMNNITNEERRIHYRSYYELEQGDLKYKIYTLRKCG
jgi:SAM-dependent methyltransferase